MSGALSHPPARIIRNMLADLGYGTHWDAAGSWPLYFNQLPDSPDNCIAIHDTEGVRHGRDMAAGSVVEHYGIQILVRGSDPTEAYAKANDIAIALDAVSDIQVTVSESVYNVHSVLRSPVLRIGPEASAIRRYLYSINATVGLWLVEEGTGTAT